MATLLDGITVLDFSDMHTDPQAVALNLIWSLENRELGNYKATGHPVRFSKTPVMPRTGAPTLGEHSDAGLAECGFDAAGIASLRTAGTVK